MCEKLVAEINVKSSIAKLQLKKKFLQKNLLLRNCVVKRF